MEIVMTASSVNLILERIDKIELELSAIRVEMAETRGAFRIAKFVLSLLGLAGISSFMAWIAGQGK
jgi:hypothetical protein